MPKSENECNEYLVFILVEHAHPPCLMLFSATSPAEKKSSFHSEDELREYVEIHKLSDNRVIFMNLFRFISYVSNVTSVNFDAYSCILALSNDAINPFLNFGASAV